MKKIILSVLIVSITTTAKSQSLIHRHGERMKNHYGMIMQKLNLSEDQKTKFKSQQETFHKQMEELRKNDNITVKEWRSKMEVLRKDHKANMMGLLTDDQKAQLDKMKTEHKAMQEVNANARMEKMKIRLGLTDEQAAKMNKNRTELMEKMKTLREDDKIDAEKKKEQMKELMKQQKEQMKSILTEDQLKKMQEDIKQRQPKREVI